MALGFALPALQSLTGGGALQNSANLGDDKLATDLRTGKKVSEGITINAVNYGPYVIAAVAIAAFVYYKRR